MLDYQSLPLEIWLLILEKAIASDRDVDFITASYTPFRPAPDDSLDSAITVRANLALVCREWKDLTTRFLYEDVRITQSVDINAFRDSLRQHSRLVRRLILPYRSTVTPPVHNTSRHSLEILRLCTNLETLVRPRLISPSESLQFHFAVDGFPLLNLRRLDWWCHSEAERSGGINSLNAVLQGTPNLEYLSVGGFTGYPVLRARSPLTLNRLHTLRLQGSDGLFLHAMSNRWSLPALAKIIVDSPVAHGQAGFSYIWEHFGEQLQTVEFGKHVRFMMEDYVSFCLQGCPNLEEFNYFPFFTTPLPQNSLRHTRIARIALHAAVNHILHDGPTVCDHIEKHFSVFLDDTFPALRQLVLYGEWRGIIAHPHLAKIWEALEKRGIMAAPPVFQ
ncbi:hypothetical protein DXG01_009757 [Tephrocybe rancida]|nr:hypothetical protein DXG01_009757 [Tephrocybe rancida]